MKKLFTWIGKAAVAGAAALLLLCLWCSFYYNVPIHYTNETGATEYKWESHKFFRKGTEGFAFGRTNNDGFNNLRDYTPGEQIDILLMGSSHMEGMNVQPEENTAAVLNRLFAGEKYTYNIGTSGHTLMYCLKHLEAALDTYAPGGFVVIETRTLDFSQAELTAVAEGTLADIPSHTGGLVELLQRAPYLRLIYTKYMKGGDGDGEPQQQASPLQTDAAEKAALLNTVLSRAAECCRTHGAQLIIVYDPVIYADETGAGYTETNPADLAAMETACRENGIQLVDLTASYLAGFKSQHKLPYGFANTSPGSGHMNAWGHRLFAQAVYETIRGEED